MSKILIALATTMLAQPAGQSFGGSYLFKVDDAAQIVPATQLVNDDLAEGDHVATCQALDSTNAPMGDVVSVSFSLKDGQIVVPGTPTPAPPPTDNTYPAPLSLTATVVTS